MKYLPITLSCCLLAAVATIRPAPANPTATVVRVGIYQNSPKVFWDHSGQPTGFWVELLNQIGAEEDWTIVAVPCRWQQCLADLESEKLDLMVDMAYSDERARRFDFNQEVVLSSWSVVYARKGLILNSLIDLNHKRVAVLKSSIQADMLAQRAKKLDIAPTFVEVSDFDAMLELLDQGRVDAVVINRFLGARAEPEHQMVRTNILIEASQLYFAAPKGRHPDLLRAIDRDLRALKQDPDSIYYQLIQRWLEPPLSLDRATLLRLFWLLGLIGGGGVVVVVAGWNYTLRRQVKQRQQVETVLREREQFLSSIYEQANQPMFIVDVLQGEFRYVSINPALEQIMGLSMVEVQGRTPAQILPPEYAAAVARCYQRCIDAGTAIVYEEYLPFQGQDFWWVTSLAPVRDNTGRIYRLIGTPTDITARRLMEERLQALAANMPGVIYRYMLRPDGSEAMTFVSSGIQELFGVSAEAVMENVFLIWQMIPPQDRSDLRASILESARTLQPWTPEWRIITPSGQTKWLQTVARPQRQPNGVVVWDGLTLDISDRKQSDLKRQEIEQALIASERRYRQVVETQTDFILRSRPDTTITFANEALCQALGASLEQVMGQQWVRFANASDLEQQAVFQRIAQLSPDQPRFIVENRDQRADGQMGWTQWVNQGIFDAQGQLVQIQSVGRDITAIREAEQALKQSETLFRSLFEQARVGIVFCDEETRILRVNQRYCDIVGYTAEELQGKPFLDLTDPQVKEQNLRVFQEMIAGKIDTFVLEKRYRRKDGAWVWVEVTGSVIRDDTGHPQLMAGIVDDISDRKRIEAERQQVEQALRESERSLTTLISNLPGYVYRVANDSNYTAEFISEGVFAITGYRQTEYLFDRTISCGQEIHADDRDSVWEIVQQALVQHQPYECEYRIITKTGDLKWVWERGQGIFDDDGTLLHLEGFVTDVSERKQAETALRESEERFRLVTENMSDLVCLHSPDGRYLYVTPSSQLLLGYRPEELIGTDPYGLFHPEDRDRIRQQSHQRVLAGNLMAITYRMQTKSGAFIWLETITKPILDDSGQVIHLQTISRDVTDRVRVEERLRHDTRHDTLTNLPNRNFLMERIDLALKRTRRYPSSQFALLFLDLDNFKVINDSLGHLAGDQLLIYVADKLLGFIRATDLAARLGGDEFVILLEDITNLEEAIRVADRIGEDLRLPLMLNGREIVVSTSIGIVGSSSLHQRPDDLMRDADIAMYRAKASGRARYAIFDPSMHLQAMQRLHLESDLRRAIERQEFVLYYQPIVALDNQQITGFEALIRWQHPQRGLISPQDFIGVAEETGMILPIGQWVLETACHQLATWQRQLPPHMPLKMGVNLSPEQLQDPNLMPQLDQLLSTTAIQAQSLVLEITESVLIQNFNSSRALLMEAKSRGLSISIDDFGTGYSSLSYLHQLPVDALKIDRAFLQEMEQESKHHTIVETILALSHLLGLAAIAEGIETPLQATWLQALGCKFGQGYWFSKPVPADVATRLVLKGDCQDLA